MILELLIWIMTLQKSEERIRRKINENNYIYHSQDFARR